ncbi:unnamed protein product [Auanema sp. JU1783]|nr:unnamed protein product [Auanema sp. JU1783]
MPMLSRQSESKQKWRGAELNISEDYSRSLSSYSSSSEPQTPSPLDGSFNGLLLFDTMDFKNLRNSFNLYDCREVEDHTVKQKRLPPRKFKKSNRKVNNLYMMKSQEATLFNSPPKSILVRPEENFTVIANTDLERPQPVQKQRERAASVTTPPSNRLNIGRIRSNTICANKTLRTEDNRRDRLYSTESESNDCAYCKSIGREHYGHTKQKCPRIGLLEPCKLCGAEGYDNHTVTHCPSSSKVYLELDPSFSERLMRAQRARGAVCEVQ